MVDGRNCPLTQEEITNHMEAINMKEVKDRIVFESDPKILLDKLVKLIEEYKKENNAMSFRA